MFKPPVANPKESIKIENVVASTGIGQELDLESVAMDLEGADYDPEQFPGLVYRTQNPKSAALIFRSGKIVCTGAKSTEAVHESLEIVFDELRALQIQVEEDPEIIVQNIVSSADLDHSLNLNAIAIGLGLENIEYEPEQFPGLVYRLDDPKVVALLFGSGKLVITGGKEVEDAEAAVDVIVERLGDLGLLE
jgi:transcription initiation factor TFIID TATA-box-binding protein